jgi:hypothetical protein
MIMDEDYTGGAGRNRLLKDFSGMDNAAIQAADRYLGNFD